MQHNLPFFTLPILGTLIHIITNKILQCKYTKKKKRSDSYFTIQNIHFTNQNIHNRIHSWQRKKKATKNNEISIKSNSFKNFFLNKKKSTFGVPQGFEDSLVTQGVLATLHNEGKPVVDTLMSLLLKKFTKSRNHNPFRR